MKTMKQLMEREQKLNKELVEVQAEIKALENIKEAKDFIEADKGRVRIYKWSKTIKDFPMPKGFEMAEFMDLVNLYDDGFKLDENGYYFTKHFSKKQQKKEYCLSGLYLYGNLYLDSDGNDLADSNDYGRVVCVRKK